MDTPDIKPKWIKFVLIENKSKTKVFDIVYNDERGDVGGLVLGKIKWFPRWRKYGFFPDTDTVWEQDCMKNVIDFLNQLKIERGNL